MNGKKISLASTLLAIASLGACSPSVTPQMAEVKTPVPASQGPVAPQTRQSYADWIADFKREARAQGISQSVLDAAFADSSMPLENVLRRDRTQPEKTTTFAVYRKGFLTQARLDAAEEQWQSHAETLAQVQRTYRVPIPILLSLWQTESRFGERQGDISIVNALATLAYDGRRAAFFRKELMNAMRILERERIDPRTLTGSWAGAMGEVQFMPSSFLAYAVDFDGDGKKDIWGSDADALASMANYLKTKGWDETMGWGVRVTVPEGSGSWVRSKEIHTLRQWQAMGVQVASGIAPLKQNPLRLVMPDSDPSQAYLVTGNYEVLMDWNRSVYFATAIGLEADALANPQAH